MAIVSQLCIFFPYVLHGLCKDYLTCDIAFNAVMPLSRASTRGRYSRIEGVTSAQTPSFFHVLIMHHIVHCIDCISFYVAGICLLSIDDVPTMSSMTLMKNYYYLQKCQASKTPLFIPIQSHSLTPSLFYCIRTTTFQLLHAAVAEPLSSAWLVSLAVPCGLRRLAWYLSYDLVPSVGSCR